MAKLSEVERQLRQARRLRDTMLLEKKLADLTFVLEALLTTDEYNQLTLLREELKRAQESLKCSAKYAAELFAAVTDLRRLRKHVSSRTPHDRNQQAAIDCHLVYDTCIKLAAFFSPTPTDFVSELLNVEMDEQRNTALTDKLWCASGHQVIDTKHVASGRADADAGSQPEPEVELDSKHPVVAAATAAVAAAEVRPDAHKLAANLLTQ